MTSEKNGSSRCHYLVDPLNESTRDDSSDRQDQDINPPIKDNLWTEAWAKTKRTIKALMNMCKECNREYTFCKAFVQVQDIVIVLAEKGCTVLELECHRKYHPSTQQSCGSPISWQSVCQHCLEQHLAYQREKCLKQMMGRELQILQQNQVRITGLLCLHNTLQNAYFLD